MRELLTRERIEQLMIYMAGVISGEGRIYFTGGVTALLHGWRESTIDVDLIAHPEPAGFFAALPKIKDGFNINLELVAPHDFLPPLPGWESRSLYIARHGKLDFYHYDLYSQALSKIQRDHDRDRKDVAGMLRDRLIKADRLLELFQAIQPGLIRYPKVEPTLFAERVFRVAAGV